MPLEMKDKLQQCLISTGFNFTSLLVIKIHLLLARPKILCSLCFANFPFLTQGPAPGVFKEQSWSTYTFSLVCKGLFLYGTCHLHFQLTSQTCLSGHTETKQTQTLVTVTSHNKKSIAHKTHHLYACITTVGNNLWYHGVVFFHLYHLRY